jgi:hypothetical protein
MTMPIVYSQFSPAADFYTRLLTSLYHNQYRLYDPDYGLIRDPDLYEKLFRDPDISGALYKRFHDVAGRNWHVEPYSDSENDKNVAQVATDGMRQLENLLRARALLARACLYGRTYAFIHGKRKYLPLGPYPAQMWWVPTYLEVIDKRRVDYVPMKSRGEGEGGTDVIHTRPRLWSVDRNRWEEILYPNSMIEYIYSDEEGRLGYGRPALGEALFFYQRFIAIAMERGLQALDRFVGGLLVANINDTRLASINKDNQTIRDLYKNEIDKSRGNHTLVMGKDDKVEVHDLPANSQQGVIEWVKMLKESCVKLILGSVRPTGGGEGGSLARTSEEAETTDSLIQFDRQSLDEIFTGSVLKLFLKTNFSIFTMLGLKDFVDRRPQFNSLQEKKENYSKNAADLKVLLDAGMKVKADEAYRKVGFTMPSPTDQILETTPKAQPSPFGGGFGSGFPPEKPGQEETQTPQLPDSNAPEAKPNE